VGFVYQAPVSTGAGLTAAIPPNDGVSEINTVTTPPPRRRMMVFQKLIRSPRRRHAAE
jgi:hypothetical protein